MADENVISGLIRKRNEIVARIGHLREAVKQSVFDLDAIDASLQIFEPDIHLMPSRGEVVPAPLQAFRGEITRSVLSILRKAETPLTIHEIAKMILADRGLNYDDVRVRRVMTNRVGSCLRNWRTNGSVTADDADGARKRWKLS